MLTKRLIKLKIQKKSTPLHDSFCDLCHPTTTNTKSSERRRMGAGLNLQIQHAPIQSVETQSIRAVTGVSRKTCDILTELKCLLTQKSAADSQSARVMLSKPRCASMFNKASDFCHHIYKYVLLLQCLKTKLMILYQKTEKRCLFFIKWCTKRSSIRLKC